MGTWMLLVQLHYWHGCTPKQCPVVVDSVWETEDKCGEAMVAWSRRAIKLYIEQRPVLVEPWAMCRERSVPEDKDLQWMTDRYAK